MAYNYYRIVDDLNNLVVRSPRIRLSDISVMLGIDRHTIERAVRSTKHMSFRQYKNSRLLQKAKSMLKTSDLSVGEIGARLGYWSLSSFCRFVQRSTGKSPGRLRGKI